MEPVCSTGRVITAWNNDSPKIMDAEYVSFQLRGKKRNKRRQAICEELEKMESVPKVLGQTLFDLRQDMIIGKSLGE